MSIEQISLTSLFLWKLSIASTISDVHFISFHEFSVLTTKCYCKFKTYQKRKDRVSCKALINGTDARVHCKLFICSSVIIRKQFIRKSNNLSLFGIKIESERYKGSIKRFNLIENNNVLGIGRNLQSSKPIDLTFNFIFENNSKLKFLPTVFFFHALLLSKS